MSSYHTIEKVVKMHKRSAELTRQFKALLTAHVRTIKSASAYASKLNVSSGYLNEAVKKVTGINSKLLDWPGIIQRSAYSSKLILLRDC